MTTQDANLRFTDLVEEILQSRWNFYPNAASGLGLHQYDGRLPNVTAASLSGRARELEDQIELLDRIDLQTLSRQNYFDHKILLLALRKELFELAELRIYEKNPMETLWHVEFSNYVNRDYAPLEQRVTALTNALLAVPQFMDDLKANLRNVAAPVLDAAAEAYGGIASFYTDDIPKAIEELSDAGIKARCYDACHAASWAVTGFVDHLKSLKNGATNEFAIGPDNFAGMLKYGEMVDLPLERVLDVGVKDLERNLARFREVAFRIDSARSPAEVMAEIAKEHPTAESLIPETRDMLEEIRQFLIDNEIVSVPSEVRCRTVETPSFMRWATAAMDLPGALETRATEAFYYVTPVEDHWTAEQREQWLSSFNYPTLKNVSVHEAYPGHYVHYLHTRNASSRISRIYGAYSFWEGWAHYTEEMMIDAGYGGHDPRLVLGQISDALLRDCRYVCAIRMHTQGMMVDEATQFFMGNAYMEELPASKEAMRGTFDPMYLNYTLGKLMILKLREDYRREQGSTYSLRRFHDTLLSFGAPQIPLVREMMLAHAGSEVL
jgi:uncharacterized protein (DUF885 family)